MLVKTHVFSGDKRVYEVRGDALKFDGRAVFFIIATYQCSVGIINLGGSRYNGVFNVLHIR